MSLGPISLVRRIARQWLLYIGAWCPRRNGAGAETTHGRTENKKPHSESHHRLALDPIRFRLLLETKGPAASWVFLAALGIVGTFVVVIALVQVV